MYDEEKIKKEGNGIKINLSLLALKYESNPAILAKILCSQIKEAIDTVFPSNGCSTFNRINRQERNAYLEEFLREVVDKCLEIQEEICQERKLNYYNKK